MHARKVLEREALASELAPHREAGRRIVLMNGVFDLLHIGHVRALVAARACGDLLVVACNGDDSVRRLKGPARPLQPVADRCEILAALASVDYVTWFDEDDLAATLRALQPHVHAKGGDYRLESIPATERAVAEELGIEHALVGGEKVRATSAIIEQLRSTDVEA